jgi:F-type H+-transporting ATPase subunit a
LEHVSDSYSWHVLTVNGVHISLPLPVILYSSTSGAHLFMSSKITHGHPYHGFRLAASGTYEGKIVEDTPRGEVRPVDISITKTVFAMLVSMTLLVIIFVWASRRYQHHPDKAPRGLQNALEVFILFVRDDIARPLIGKHYSRYMPYLLTVFFFIWLNNIMGLIPILPGGANVTGNIAVTMGLALLTFFITLFSGNKSYWLHIVNTPGVPWWLKIPLPLMPIVEVMGIFTKPIVLMIRLFANITAGHIVMLGFFSLIFIFGSISPYLGGTASPVALIFAIFMTLLELLVGFIQAYVFTLLSALYFGMAVEEHEEHQHAS